jgi:PKD repeat protein
LSGGSTTYQQITLDVDALASSNGLRLTGTFIVKFQQYDNYGISSDGMAFDDIEVMSNDIPPTADFSATPTAGYAPLTVDFTDASLLATSWSWNFGDGGTSTAKNPSYTYNDPGVYTVTLTAANAFGSDVETKNDYITVMEQGTGTWATITYDEFESGWGSNTDGGNDCSRYTYGTRAHQGSAAIDIQDNSGVASSFYHTVGYDVTGYTDLEVEFWFYAYSMDNTSEDFWLQYYNGSTWQTVETWARGIDFNNNTFYNVVVSIPAGTYNYPSNARLRFMCDASGNQDDVYIDEIEFRGYGTGSAKQTSELLLPEDFSLGQNYPNPFNPTTHIEFSLPTPSDVTLEIYNVLGQKVTTLINGQMEAGYHTITWNASNQASGIYLYQLRAGKATATKKMLLMK